MLLNMVIYISVLNVDYCSPGYFDYLIATAEIQSAVYLQYH